jgi:enoyl-CoA hydratase/carnithine racemase
MSDYTEIKVLTESKTRIIRLHRPTVLNALTNNMLSEVRQAMQACELDRSVAAIILTGNDKAFCSGGDMKASAERPLAPYDKYLSRFTQSEWHNFARFLARYPKPVIAAIEGYCLGGGLEIALICDFMIGAESAQFGLPETHHSLFPILGGAWSLTQCVGERMAKELIFTGRRINGETALSIGLLNHLTPEGQALSKAIEIAEEIGRNGPLAVAVSKQAVDRSRKQSFDEGLTAAGEFSALLFFSEDREEGLNAFKEKRKPEFKGK